MNIIAKELIQHPISATTAVLGLCITTISALSRHSNLAGGQGTPNYAMLGIFGGLIITTTALLVRVSK